MWGGAGRVISLEGSASSTTRGLWSPEAVGVGEGTVPPARGLLPEPLQPGGLLLTALV